MEAAQHAPDREPYIVRAIWDGDPPRFPGPWTRRSYEGARGLYDEILRHPEGTLLQLDLLEDVGDHELLLEQWEASSAPAKTGGR